MWISTLSARKNDKRKDKNTSDDEADDDDKARELNYDLEINIYFDNAFEKRSTAPKWNEKKGCWEEFDPKKHGYNYYDKDVQGWDHTNNINMIYLILYNLIFRPIVGQKLIPENRMESL